MTYIGKQDNIECDMAIKYSERYIIHLRLYYNHTKAAGKSRIHNFGTKELRRPH